MNKTENNFIDFLKNIAEKDTGGELAESTQKTILSNIKTSIPKELNIDSIFDIKDIGIIEDYSHEINGTDFDNGRKNAPKQALKFYIQFLKKNEYDEEVSNMNTHESKIDDLCIKNIILYGSPGVGKTHNTKKLISLIESGMSDKEIFKIIKNNELNNVVDIDDIKDRVKFITFHQSFGYEDFIEGFRPNDEGNIELEDGVFKNICDDAQKNLDTSNIDTNIKVVNVDDLFSRFVSHVQDSLDKEKEYILHDKITIESINDNKSLLLGGSIKSNTQRLAVDMVNRDYQQFKIGEITSYENIKPKYNSQRVFHGNARYYYFLYQKLFEYEQSIGSKSVELKQEELKNYYLIIDEINRGNISKIFGELITLIEEDKRDTLEVTLPYSKKPFKIPSNLYIIGTMNSTDKSIALIDIALRRRFTFVKMEPNSNLVDNEKAKNIMKQLNEKITETLGSDYVLGHSYFMKIQNEDDLKFVLEYKVKPLLEEYYYGDNQGLKNILEIINESI